MICINRDDYEDKEVTQEPTTKKEKQNKRSKRTRAFMTNGMVERVNRTLIHIISTFCDGKQDLWANHTKETEYAINTRVSSVTKHSPYELVYGRIPPDPVYTDIIQADQKRKGGR